MKTALIFLIGNRDIQVADTQRDNLAAKFTDHLVENTEGTENFWIINKARNAPKKFLEVSKMMWETKSFQEFASFPLLEQTLTILDNRTVKIDTIFLSTSEQKPLHTQDCVYFAHIIQKHLQKKGIKCELKLCPQRPTDFRAMVEFYSGLYSEVKKTFDQIIISNSGGTPAMRSASHFAGIFRNFEYITLNSDDKANAETFKRQEYLILNNIIESMLQVYDYEGIAKLPVEEGIRKKCTEALKDYNFSTELISKDTNDYETKSINALALLYNNLHLCFTQGRFADVIGRIFRMEEAIWQLLFFKELKSSGYINERDKVCKNKNGREKYDKKFESFLKSARSRESFLVNYYGEYFVFLEENEYYFTSYNSVPMRSGKNFYYFFFKSLQKKQAFTDYFARLNNDYDSQNNRLSSLRNKSILGHGFEGIDEEDVEDVTGGFTKFFKELGVLLKNELHVNIDISFDKINNEIRQLLK